MKDIPNQLRNLQKVENYGSFQHGTFYFRNGNPHFCKNRFLANAKNEDINFENKKSHVEKINNFQLFLDFSTDLECLAIKFFKTGFNHAYIFI